MARRRKHRKYGKRHNPIGSLTAPWRAFTAGYSVETLKLAGSVLGGGLVTMLGSNLLIDNVMRKFIKGASTDWLVKATDFLATGLVAGIVATGSRYVLPYRGNEVLAGGMLAAFSRLGIGQAPPKLAGWSEDLSMGPMNIGDYADPREVSAPIMDGMGDFADPRRASMPVMYGMGDFVNAGPQAPINRPMLADYSAFRQVGNPIQMTGMEGVIAQAIDEE